MTTTDRDFLVFRRRPHLVDILTPKREGVQGYRLKAARNFDVTPQTIITADIGAGYLDPTALGNGNINRVTLGSAPGEHVRIVFDPDSFSAHAANLDDNEHMWLQFAPVDFSGSEGTPGALTLILPDDENKATGRVVIAGTAPTGATVANSLRLDMPLRMRDFYIRNEEASGSTDLKIATAEGGPEVTVPPQSEVSFLDGGQGTILVRGDGGTAGFSATMTHYLPL
jgi:hypothetical protein